MKQYSSYIKGKKKRFFFPLILTPKFSPLNAKFDVYHSIYFLFSFKLTYFLYCSSVSIL